MWLTVFSHRCRHCRSTSLFTFNKIYPKIHSIPRTLSELFLWMDEVSFSKKYAFLFPFFSPKSQSSCWKVDGVLFPAQGVCVCVFVCVCVCGCVFTFVLQSNNGRCRNRTGQQTISREKYRALIQLGEFSY